MIEINSLTKSYNSVEVLKQFDLRIEGDRVHGFVGKNGAGKTTLFNCLAQMEPYTGSINYAKGNLRTDCAYLPTDPHMMSFLTGHEYLWLLCNARDISKIDHEIQDLFNLPLERYISAYSTGMKKKLALTGLLMQGSQVYLLDEPFNGVDLESNLLIQSLIVRLKELGKLVIISSHICQTLKDSCDLIHHLEDGQVKRTYQREDFHLLEHAISSYSTKGTISQLKL